MSNRLCWTVVADPDHEGHHLVACVIENENGFQAPDTRDRPHLSTRDLGEATAEAAARNAHLGHTPAEAADITARWQARTHLFAFIAYLAARGIEARPTPRDGITLDARAARRLRDLLKNADGDRPTPT